jgi:glycosyltransferase involved in cell wall biosynthesis
VHRINQAFGLQYISSTSSFQLQKHPLYQEAEILNFHNLHSGYFNYLAISSLTQSKPAVLTLHDMWSFTGHCSYSYDCDRWKIGCGQCPYPNVYPAISRDSTHLEWKLKDWVYARSNLTIVAPSKWLVEQAKQSMLQRFPIHHIPYGVDLTLYEPLDPLHCRALLGIPPNKKVMMFCAFDLADSRKGGDLLLAALQLLPETLKAESMLLTIGSSSNLEQMTGIPTLNLGQVAHDRLKAIAYSAADVFVLPTRADNLPLVLQESLACGTPIVASRVGGVPDLVRPGVTGYLAEPENATDLKDGIVKVLDADDFREQLRQQCRSIALEECSLELQAHRYIELYHQLI